MDLQELAGEWGIEEKSLRKLSAIVLGQRVYPFTMKNWKSSLMLAFLILFPMLLIILQRETGSALVYSCLLYTSFGPSYR